MFDPSSAGHTHAHQKAEATLKPHLASNPVHISPATELRRHSEVSLATTSGEDATHSVGRQPAQPNLLDAGLEGHVPHLICKPSDPGPSCPTRFHMSNLSFARAVRNIHSII